MPIAKICPYCGKVLKPGERCECVTARLNERFKRYDKYHRNKKSKDFYDSPAWDQMRKVILERYHYLDLYDLKVNHVMTPADTLHHIIPLTENWDLRLVEDNLIPLSRSNHAMVHDIYETEDKEKFQNVLRGLIGE